MSAEQQPLGYEYSGGRGPCVTLLHGFPLDRTMWRATVDGLRQHGREVLCVDLPGFGDSSSAPATSMASMARSIVELWDQLGIERSAVVGFSMGGYVALQLLDRHADRVAGALFVASKADPDDATTKAGREESAVRVERDGTGILVDPMVDALLSLSTRRDNPDLVEQLKETMLRQQPEGVAAALRAMAKRPDMRNMPVPDVPCGVVCGALDGITPEVPAGQALARAVGTQPVVIEQAAHAVPLEAPDAWWDALQAYLNDV